MLSNDFVQRFISFWLGLFANIYPKFLETLFWARQVCVQCRQLLCTPSPIKSAGPQGPPTLTPGCPPGRAPATEHHGLRCLVSPRRARGSTYHSLCSLWRVCSFFYSVNSLPILKTQNSSITVPGTPEKCPENTSLYDSLLILSVLYVLLVPSSATISYVEGQAVYFLTTVFLCWARSWWCSSVLDGAPDTHGTAPGKCRAWSEVRAPMKNRSSVHSTELKGSSLGDPGEWPPPNLR